MAPCCDHAAAWESQGWFHCYHSLVAGVHAPWFCPPSVPTLSSQLSPRPPHLRFPLGCLPSGLVWGPVPRERYGGSSEAPPGHQRTQALSQRESVLQIIGRYVGTLWEAGPWPWE